MVSSWFLKLARYKNFYMKTLQDWHFNNSFHALGSSFYRSIKPQGLNDPCIVHCNPHALNLLNLSTDSFNNTDFISVLSGNQLLPSMKPIAQDYAGHQFGRFNPMLGDGRVVILGELLGKTGSWELSLKGVRRTPFARNSHQADGLAGVVECAHEFHISQQLELLDVPTIHSIAVIKGKQPNKQQAYRNHRFEATAILSRMAPTHIRFGTFELYYSQGNKEALKQLCDYVIRQHYPECNNPELSNAQRYACFFNQVVSRTACLIAHWQTVGFTHGVMNTDNQSIIGITLDLGAAKFTTDFNPKFVASSIDDKGLYAFGNQPSMGLWNCNVLARALSPIIDSKALRQALQTYETTYLTKYEALKT